MGCCVGRARWGQGCHYSRQVNVRGRAGQSARHWGGYTLGKLGLSQESRTLPENWEIRNHSCSKSKNPLLFPGSLSPNGTERSQMLTFMNLPSQPSFSIFQVLGGQNISRLYKPLQGRAGDPSGSNTAGPSQGHRSLFERTLSLKDRVLS